jgi:hypothetical protein
MGMVLKRLEVPLPISPEHKQKRRQERALRAATNQEKPAAPLNLP